MNFELYYPDGTTKDLTNGTQFNTLEISARCDEAFAQGSVKVACDLEYNIPPYTLANINGAYYFVRSEVTKFQTFTNLYMHNVEIIELTAVLECFILGSKAFTSKRLTGLTRDDYKKVNQMVHLLNQKYDIVLDFDANTLSQLHEQYNDYTFGAGTTLYGALTEIFKRINAIPKVSSASYVSGTLNITFIAFNLSGNTTLTLITKRITQNTYNQNQSDYCKFLETEAQNVTDRTNLHTDTNLSLISQVGTELKFDGNDTLKLKTSAKIDYITSFKATGQINQLTIAYLAGRDFFNYLCTSEAGTAQRTYNESVIGVTYKPLRRWIEDTTDATSKARLLALVEQYAAAQYIDLNTLLNNIPFVVEYAGTTYNYTEDDTTYIDYHFTLKSSYSAPIPTKIELKDFILEKKQYEAEEMYNQPAYAYYTKATNEIGGMDVVKNDRFWESVIGIKNGPMLNEALKALSSDIQVSLEGTANFTGQPFYVGYYDVQATGNETAGPYYSYQTSTNVNAAMFEVTYAAIINPRLINEKTDDPINESAYKPFTRSYNVSAALIDYDKIQPSMETVNGMLGKPERTIEYDITNLTGANIPALTNNIGGMYLLSYSIRYYSNHMLMTLNLFKSYSKVAEAIGVAYQYRATNFATDEIIERPCYFSVAATSTQKAQLDAKSDRIYFYFDFQDTQILTRAILMKSGNKRILYAEALDQFAWGINLKGYTSNGVEKKFGEYVPYGDSNNELMYTMDLKIGFIDNLTKDQSEKLPSPSNVDVSQINLLTIEDKHIYKDQREKLTFTIEIE